MTLFDPPLAETRPITGADEEAVFESEARRQSSTGAETLDFGLLQQVFEVAGNDLHQPGVVKKTIGQLREYFKQVHLTLDHHSDPVRTYI